LALAAALAAAAGQAQALSCMQPDPVRTFQDAHAAPEPWVVLLGRLVYGTPPPIPDPMNLKPGQQPRVAAFPATFSGMGLSASGFDRPYSGTIMMQPVCYGPWCGGYPGQADVLIFARVQADGSYLLEIDPCGQSVFGPPSTAVVAALTACMAGRDCVAQRN